MDKKIGPPSKRLSPSLNRKLPPNNWKEYVRLGYFFLNGMTFSSNWRTIFQCFLIPSLDASKMNEMRSGDIISNNHNVLLLNGNKLVNVYTLYYTNLLEDKNDQHICNMYFAQEFRKQKWWSEVWWKNIYCILECILAVDTIYFIWGNKSIFLIKS